MLRARRSASQARGPPCPVRAHVAATPARTSRVESFARRDVHARASHAKVNDMIEGLVQQFLGSGEASQVLGQLQQQGMSPQQAQHAVSATAEGTVQAAAQGNLGDLLGGGGLAGALGGLMGGGGGGGGLGGLLGGLGGLAGGAPQGGGSPGGSVGGSVGALPPQLVDGIATFVSQKTGLQPAMAKTAVNVVLPKIVDFVKSKLG